ncbi:MAG: Stp1/IreP family PP2C-type Ser/Thr phosphatase [Clostridiales Family XIII bacterium]|jgi:protein phosphatase|nr:Stp1/IreP family PP2C-type Ser/Thr phosphatase [Clostridiales Family XIII bacterium]
MMKFGFRTDTGRERSENQDALLVLPKFGMYAVCDGVGGRRGGEIASRKATLGIESYLLSHSVDEAKDLDGDYRSNWFKSYFFQCFQRINTDILDYAAAHKDTDGMATTAVACYVDGGRLYIVNIGDSRAYVVRDNTITQLSEDHTYVNALVNAGTLTKGEAQTHPQKNMITRALGAVERAEPDFYSFDLKEGDRILLCSDGLTGELTDDEICDIIAGGKDANSACKSLVKAANAHGGNDNITVILLLN